MTSSNINVSILNDAVYVAFPGDMESQLDMCTIDSWGHVREFTRRINIQIATEKSVKSEEDYPFVSVSCEDGCPTQVSLATIRTRAWRK